jgi:hypothetical protein
LSDYFLIQNFLKQSDVLLAQLFKFALQYAIGEVQETQARIKLNGLYADDVNLPGDKVDTTIGKHRNFN